MPVPSFVASGSTPRVSEPTTPLAIFPSRYSEPQQTALGPVAGVDAVLVEGGARGGAGAVRRDLGGVEHGLLGEEELAGVAGVAALVAGVGHLAAHVHLGVDVHAPAPVPAGEDGGELDEAVPVGELGAAQIPLVVGRILVAAAGAGLRWAAYRSGRPVGGYRWRGAPVGGVPPPPLLESS